MKKKSDEDLLNDLRIFINKHNYIPRVKTDFLNKNNLCSYTTYKNRFKTDDYFKILEMAGIDLTQEEKYELLKLGGQNRKNITKDKAEEIVLDMQDKLDRPLLYDDFRNPSSSNIGIATVKKYWGSLNKMKEELNLRINQEDMVAKQKSEDEMLDELQLLINELGRIPTSDEIDNCTYTLSQSVYFRKFGGINNAFLKLGHLPNKKVISHYLTNDNILKIYKEFIEDIGITPSYELCKSIYKLPSPRTVLRRFNCSWNEFIEMLGFNPNEQTTIQNICYAKDGTQCLSSSEFIIHNFLLDKNILNLRKEIEYRDILASDSLKEKAGLKRCDWTFEYNNNLYIVEYFGIMTSEKYRETHDFKMDLIKSDGKINNFIAIYPNTLCKLDDIFKFIC